MTDMPLMKITIVEDATDSAYLVCPVLTRPLLFPDNMVGVCSHCGDAIQFRPHAPRQPLLLCIRCFITDEPGDVGDKPTVIITRKTADELKAIAKKREN